MPQKSNIYENTKKNQKVEEYNNLTKENAIEGFNSNKISRRKDQQIEDSIVKSIQ